MFQWLGKLNPFRRREPTLAEQIQTKRQQLDLKMLEASSALYDNLIDPREPFLDDPEFWFPLGSGEQVPQNIDSRKRGEVLPVYLTEYGLKLLRDKSRHQCHYNEFAINAVENRVSYIVGKGMKTTAVRKNGKPGQPASKDPLAGQVQAVIDEFQSRERWGERQQEIVRRGDRDGEAILRFFHVGQGRAAVRYVEPEHLKDPNNRPQSRFGVETSEEDVEDIRGYWIIENPDRSMIPVFVKADEVVHLKLNVDQSAKRGLPTFLPVRKNLDRAEKLLQNMSILATVQSTYAVIRKHKNYSAAAIAAFQQGQADTSYNNPFTNQTQFVQRRLPGSIIDTTEGTDYEFPAAQVNAGALVQILQAELRAIASRLVMPEYMLTSDASNNNMASSLVAEAPAVKNFERLQSFYANRFGDGEYGRGNQCGVLWRVIAIAVDAGLLPPEALTDVELQVEGPSLVVRNKAAETNRAKTLAESGILSQDTWAAWEGLDFEQEKAKGAKPKQEASMFGGPPGGPGGGLASMLGPLGESLLLEGMTAQDLVRPVQDYLNTMYRMAGQDLPDLDDGQIAEALRYILGKFEEDVGEACVPNRSGRGHHDDKTGYPCSVGGSEPGRLARTAAAVGNKVGGAVHAAGSELHRRYVNAAGGHASKLLKTAGGLVKDAAVKAGKAAWNLFAGWRKQYGLVGAIAITVASAAMIPVPVPGASLAPAYAAAGVKAIVNRLRSEPSVARQPQREAPKQRELSEAGKRVSTLICRGLKTKRLTEAQRKDYGQAVNRVLGRMPDTALGRIHDQTEIAHFFGSDRQLTSTLVANGLLSAEKVKARGHMTQGAYSFNPKKHKGNLLLDGASRLGGGDFGGGTVHETYAHELTHAIDGPRLEHSGSAAWQKAFREEIDRDSPSGTGSSLTRYARKMPPEGFAEFGRLLYGGEADLAKVAKRFPKCSAYFKRAGLWPSDSVAGEAVEDDDGQMLADVFTRLIPLKGGGHADAVAADETQESLLEDERRDKRGRRYCIDNGRRVPCQKAEKPKRPERMSVEDALKHVELVRENPSPEDVKALAGVLVNMRGKDLHTLKKRLGVRAGGRKSVLSEKLAKLATQRLTVREHYAREARKAGIRPADLYRHARELRGIHGQLVDEANGAITRARDLFAHYNDGQQLRRSNRAFRDGDHTQLGGWDKIAATVASDFPGVFAGTDDQQAEQLLYDLIAGGRPRKMAHEDGYKNALGYLVDKRQRDEDEVPF